MNRIAICGGPRTGKTSYAEFLAHGTDIPVRHTDDVAHLAWSDASTVVSTWFDEREPVIIEGVRVPHALRKWIERNIENREAPCDVLYVLLTPREEQSPGQKAMAKGGMTVLEGIEAELKRRGVSVRRIG